MTHERHISLLSGEHFSPMKNRVPYRRESIIKYNNPDIELNKIDIAVIDIIDSLKKSNQSKVNSYHLAKLLQISNKEVELSFKKLNTKTGCKIRKIN